MDEKKIVTWEMFKKYHEQLVGYIEDGDGIVIDDIITKEELEEGGEVNE